MRVYTNNKFRARWNAISQLQKHIKQPWEKAQFMAVYRSAKNKDCGPRTGYKTRTKI